MTRQEDISYDFLGNDRIWPPFIASNTNHPFIKALVEVLERLPEDAYDKVAEQTSFVVKDPRFLATNAPFDQYYPPPKSELRVRFNTIVIFHAALECSHKALVGLIAHEIARGFVTQSDYRTDEKETDLQAIRWGFAEELEALQVAKDLQ
jgi:hypothetical protein